ncbi:MAG TPA: hypothetical protein VF600_14100 [Abditibacteriaceae bacterium]|jgi:hypothetical protein
MSDYLSTLAARSHDAQSTLQPRVSSLFEPLPETTPFSSNVNVDTNAESPFAEATQSASAPVASPRASSPFATPTAFPTPTPRPTTAPHEPLLNTQSTHLQLAVEPTESHALKTENSLHLPSERQPPIAPRMEAALPSHKNAIDPGSVFQPNITRRSEAPLPVEMPTQTAPTIKVTIGRIEVRAVMPSSPPTRRAHSTAASTTKLSIDEYLKQRSGGQR